MLKKNIEDIATTWLKTQSIFHIQSKSILWQTEIKKIWTCSNLKITWQFCKFISYPHWKWRILRSNIVILSFMLSFLGQMKKNQMITNNPIHQPHNGVCALTNWLNNGSYLENGLLTWPIYSSHLYFKDILW